MVLQTSQFARKGDFELILPALASEGNSMQCVYLGGSRRGVQRAGGDVRLPQL
jgi:hypothetical protein